MPLSLFMLLFGLSMDYEVFMVSRIRGGVGEERATPSKRVARGLEADRRRRPPRPATIMVAIFASFLLVAIPER